MEEDGVIRATTAENMAAATEHFNRGNGATGSEVRKPASLSGMGADGKCTATNPIHMIVGCIVCVCV